MTGAAALGLGLKKITGRNSKGLFWRTYYTAYYSETCPETIVVDGAEYIKKSSTPKFNDDDDRAGKRKAKSIYLCFKESSFQGPAEYTSQVIRPIKLPLNYTKHDDGTVQNLSEAAYKTTKGQAYIGACSTHRSTLATGFKRSIYGKSPAFINDGPDIIFPFGRNANCATHILRFDPYIRPIRFPTDQKLKACFAITSHLPNTMPIVPCDFTGRHESQTTLGCFAMDKHNVVLGHVSDSLYCFSNDTRFPLDPNARSFQRFDQENWVMWKSFPAPPFIRGMFSPHFNVAFLDKGLKMLGWEVDKAGVFCWNTYKVATYWKQVSSHLGDELPFINFYGKRPFLISEYDSNIGPVHLIFNYDPDRNPLIVSAYFMSHDLNTFRRIINIQLPEMCYEYLVRGDYDEVECDLKHGLPNICSDFEFVCLGNRKFGLVLHKYFEDCRDQGRNTGIVLLVTFEYDINLATREIKPRILMTRRFRYQTKQLGVKLCYRGLLSVP